MGLLVTMALSHSAQVWLPRGLYTLLDNDAHYRRYPEQMGGEGWLDAATRPQLLRDMTVELEPWRQAWQNGRLSSRVHWIADAQFESALPDRDQRSLLPRFESCCVALDARPGISGEFSRSHLPPLDECARDVIALAAALQPETTYILTAAGTEGQAPPLCRYLAGLRFPQPAAWRGLAGWDDAAFAPAWAPLAASGTEAAIVQIAAPVVLALPDGWNGDWDGEEAPEPEEELINDLWRNACALWRPLAPSAAAS